MRTRLICLVNKRTVDWHAVCVLYTYQNGCRKERMEKMSACPGVETGPKVLVVDDDINAIKLVKLNLEAYGFEMVTAVSGKEGMDKALSEKPDAVILDVRMPDVDGWQVCKWLKENLRTTAIPVIFLTAYSQKTDFEKSKKLGAALFLNKPLDPEELAQKIREVLDGNKKKEERKEESSYE